MLKFGTIVCSGTETRRSAVKTVCICAIVLSAFLIVSTGCGQEDQPMSLGAPLGFGFQPAALAKDFSVFRGSRTDRDKIPEDLVPTHVATTLALDLSAARFSRTLNGSPLFLVPSVRITCLFGKNRAVGSCWPTRTVVEQRATTTTLCGPGLSKRHIVTFGIVPDGVKRVTVMRPDGSGATAVVKGNIFVARSASTPPLPHQISWVSDSKQIVRSTGIPPDVARSGC